MFLTSVFLSLLASDVVASPVLSRSIQHEKREYTPKGWSKGERIPGDAVLPMRIGLKQQNLEKGHDLLMDVYVILEVREMSRAEHILARGTTRPTMESTILQRR